MIFSLPRELQLVVVAHMSWNLRLLFAITCKRARALVDKVESRTARVMYWVKHLDQYLTRQLHFDEIYHRPKLAKPSNWRAWAEWRLSRVCKFEAIWRRYLKGQQCAQFALPMTDETMQFLDHYCERNGHAYEPLCWGCRSALLQLKPMHELVRPFNSMRSN